MCLWFSFLCSKKKTNLTRPLNVSVSSLLKAVENILKAALYTTTVCTLRLLTEECVSQNNGLRGKRCVEASSISWDYCWLTDEGLDSIGSFASLSLGVGDGQVSYIVCAYCKLALTWRKRANGNMIAFMRTTLYKVQYLSACVRLCVLISSHLSSTQANIELVEILGSFGGKARTVHQWPRSKEAEVKS